MARVYLVGAGPGDPDLLTVKAARLLAAADVVLHDRLVHPDVLALASPRAELVYVGKEEGEQEAAQARIHELLLQHGRRPHRMIVRLKGGDPLVFGRGAEEWLFLREHGIDAELVPGVSSAVAVPGLAGIPLTFRGVARSFAVITGQEAAGPHSAWERYAGVDTLVVLMGVRERAAIAHALIAAGRATDEPAAFIERGSTPDERVTVTTLGAVAAGAVAVAAPAVLVVGAVVSLRERLGLDTLVAVAFAA